MESQAKRGLRVLGVALIALLTLVAACSVHGQGSSAPYSRDPSLIVGYVGIAAVVAWVWLLDRIK